MIVFLGVVAGIPEEGTEEDRGFALQFRKGAVCRGGKARWTGLGAAGHVESAGKKQRANARAMTQWFRAFAALLKHPDLLPSTHTTYSKMWDSGSHLTSKPERVTHP